MNPLREHHCTKSRGLQADGNYGEECAADGAKDRSAPSDMPERILLIPALRNNRGADLLERPCHSNRGNNLVAHRQRSRAHVNSGYVVGVLKRVADDVLAVNDEAAPD